MPSGTIWISLILNVRPPSPTPWGANNIWEDLATTFDHWAGDSGTPRLNANVSSSLLEEAAYRAQQGHTILLQKTMLIAALFTDPVTKQLSLYYFANYQSPTPPINRTFAQVQASPTSLTLRDFTFSIQNGALTSVISPASQVTVSGTTVNIPALNWTFPTPVPIPGYAATAWGIPQ